MIKLILNASALLTRVRQVYHKCETSVSQL